MATQTGLVLTAPAAPLEIVDNLPRPSPARGQVLVKTLFVALNPVEAWMAETAMLTTELPAVLGSDFCGVVIEAGFGCTRLKEGDCIFGLGSLGQNEYSPFQETFLIDELLAVKKGDALSQEEAASLGVSLVTASLGIFAGRQMSVPKRKKPVKELAEWVVILGGSGNIGQCAIQLSRLCGFRVATSCSAAKRKLVDRRGVEAVFDNRASTQEQVAQILSITHGNDVGHFTQVFDATGVGHEVAFEALKRSTENLKFFSTVNDFGNFKAPPPIKEYRVEAGLLGRNTESSIQATDAVARMVPLLEEYVANGDIKPVDIQVFDGVGWGALKDALAHYTSGKAARKIVVRVQ